MKTPLAALTALSLLTAPLAAQTALDAQLVLRTGDTVAGVGDVTLIRDVTIDDLGRWYADVNTDAPSNGSDDALLRNGDALFVEGQPVGAPAGASIDAFDDVDGSFTDTGEALILFLEGGGLTGNEDRVVVVNGDLILQGDTQTLVPGMTAGSTWSQFLDVKANEAGQVLVMATVDDPQLGITRALVKLQLDGLGGILDRELVAYEGMVPAGQFDEITDLEISIHEFALSDGGHAIYGVDLSGSPVLDNSILVDGAIVAREGSPSPVPGRPWQVLINSEVDVNVHGDYVLTGILTGVNDDDSLIERSGEVLIRESDVLPGISPFAVSSVGLTITPGPIHLGDNGNVLWFGTWNDPDTTSNRGLFLNDRLIARQNVTVVDGSLLTLIEGTEGSYALSDDGQHVVFRARAGADTVLVTVDVGPWTSLGGGLAGTGGVMPELVGAGPLTDNSVLDLTLAGGLPLAPATLVIGFSELGAPFKGGTLLPQPDLLVPVALDGQGGLDLALPLPGVVPPGFPFLFQVWVQDGAGPVGFAASNAVLGVAP